MNDADSVHDATSGNQTFGNLFPVAKSLWILVSRTGENFDRNP